MVFDRLLEFILYTMALSYTKSTATTTIKALKIIGFKLLPHATMRKGDYKIADSHTDFVTFQQVYIL